MLHHSRKQTCHHKNWFQHKTGESHEVYPLILGLTLIHSKVWVNAAVHSWYWALTVNHSSYKWGRLWVALSCHRCVVQATFSQYWVSSNLLAWPWLDQSLASCCLFDAPPILWLVLRSSLEQHHWHLLEVTMNTWELMYSLLTMLNK